MQGGLSRAPWKKSSCSRNSGNCVEAADLGDGVAVRDPKDPDGPVLVVSRDEWANLLTWIKC
ncbi:MAG TPA: DUF397 domain-containing protein [Streptosporangiaceae bacterium]|nr:DUF397 domain-containing protein [Streptosporangiaceae bacterium]